MTTFKTKFSLTVYADSSFGVESQALQLLAAYLGTDVETAAESLDIEILVGTNDGENEEFTSEKFKATVFASVKRNAAVNFAH